MITSLSSTGNRLLRNPSLCQYRLSVVRCRSASLNSAIHKGLRKSQGVGFRGREWSRDEAPRGGDREGRSRDKFDGRNERPPRRDPSSSEGGGRDEPTKRREKQIRLATGYNKRWLQKGRPAWAQRGSTKRTEHNEEFENTTRRQTNDEGHSRDEHRSHGDRDRAAFDDNPWTGRSQTNSSTNLGFRSLIREQTGNEANLKEKSLEDRSERNTEKRSLDLSSESTDSLTGRTRTTPRQVSHNRHIPMTIPYTTAASIFIYGTNSVTAALSTTTTHRRQLYKLYIQSFRTRDREEETSGKSNEILALARSRGVSVSFSSDVRLLDKMSAGRPHNGFVLEASPLPMLPIESLGKLASEGDRNGFRLKVAHQTREDAAINGTDNFVPDLNPELSLTSEPRLPLVLLLDGIKDPENLGSIIRTASFLGVSAIVLMARAASPITQVAIKASAGATENIRIFTIAPKVSERDFIKNSALSGWDIWVSVAPDDRRSAGRTVQNRMEDTKERRRQDPASRGQERGFSSTIYEIHELPHVLRKRPVILVLGNEGDGVKRDIKREALRRDGGFVTIKGDISKGGSSAEVDSLNVGVAAGLLCSAFLRGPSGLKWVNGELKRVDDGEGEEKKKKKKKDDGAAVSASAGTTSSSPDADVVDDVVDDNKLF